MLILYIALLSHPFTTTTIVNSFIQHIYKLHGAPFDIISDRDLIFVNHFWKEFLAKLGQQEHLSSTHYLQSDGQIEVFNKYLETSMRCVEIHNPLAWNQFMPIAEW